MNDFDVEIVNDQDMTKLCNDPKCPECGGTGAYRNGFANAMAVCYLPETQPKIVISEACDGFDILVDGKRHAFNEEDDKKKLVKVFKSLGFTNVTYEEDY